MITYAKALELTQEIGCVEEMYGGAVVAASGLPQATPGEMVVFEEGQMGIVFTLHDEMVDILILTQGVPIQAGMKLTRSGSVFRLAVGEPLFGKSLTAIGTSWRTGMGFRGLTEERAIDTPPPAFHLREPVTRPFYTGVMISDIVMPLGLGQRELVIGDHKTGKTNYLLQALMSHISQGGVAVYCGIGKRATETVAFEAFAEEKHIKENMAFVFAGAADSPGMIYLAPYTAMTLAEYFRDRGKDVLLILDDLSIHAKYYREISLLTKRYPGRLAYPGDIFSIHARLMERAGQFKTGSITCLPVAETAMGDITGYIQTNLMSMTDGHILFDTEYFNQGKRPAINPFVSVTRIGHQTQSALLKELSVEVSSFLVENEKLKDMIHFGGELTDRVKKGLDKGALWEALTQQPDEVRVPVPVAIVLIGLLWNGLITIDHRNQLPGLRQRLVEAYSKDSGWQQYMDGLMQITTFADLLTRIKADENRLATLMQI